MRTEEQESSYELHVARDTSRQDHGAFVEYSFLAFQNADTWNFEMMRPFIQGVIKKYDLRCLCDPAEPSFWKGPEPAWRREL